MIAAKPPEPHLVRGTVSLNTQAVKLVAPLIVMKSAALVERIPAQMAAVDTANAANLALLQVAHHQVVAPAHLQVVLLQKQEYGLIPTQVIQHLPVLIIIDTNVVKITAAAFLLIAAVPLYMTDSF